MTTLSRMRSQISSTETFPNGLIVTSGSVGIGTSSPSTKLHVVTSTAQNDSIGAVQLENTAAGAPTNPSNAYTNTSLTTKNIYGTSQFMQWENQGLRLGNRSITNSGLGHVYFTSGNDSVGMTLTASGNVGIGTSNPTATLSVYNPTASPADTYIDKPVNSLNGSLILRGGPSNSTSGMFIARDGGATGTYNPAGIEIYTGGSERMRITSSGNVGIGTSNPSSASILDVRANKPSAFADMQLVNDATTAGYANFAIKSQGSAYSSISMYGSSNYIFFQNSDSSANFARIYTDSSGNIGFTTGAAAPLRMIITSSGNVGIGGGVPGSFYKLEVGGNVFASQSASTEITAQSQSSHAYLIADSGSTSNANLILRRATVTRWYLANDSGTDRLYITDANANDGVYLAQNTQAWSSNSDSRLKDVQGTITNALDKVQQLTGVKFTWKRDADNPDAKVRVGLIAQDVQAVLPEAVDDDSPDLITDEETGKVSGGLGVRYTELVPLLVNAIKELKAEINELRAQVQGA